VDDRPAARDAVVQLEYCFDRLLSAKLEHAYQVLVPDHRWPVRPPAAEPKQETVNEHPRRHLRARILGSST